VCAYATVTIDNYQIIPYIKPMNIFPRIKYHTDHFGARNTLWSISINPEHPFYAAQMAQERYEYNNRWLYTLAAIVLGLVTGYFIHIVVGFILYAAIILYSMSDHNTERVEIMGHAIETSVASQFMDADFDAYLMKEARDMTWDGSSYHQKGLFKDDTAEQVAARMRSKMNSANAWVLRHIKTITKDLQK
jgi:hypothetical protein